MQCVAWRCVEFVGIEVAGAERRPEVTFRGPDRGSCGVERLERIGKRGERGGLQKFMSSLGSAAQVDQTRPIGHDDRRALPYFPLPVSFHAAGRFPQADSE